MLSVSVIAKVRGRYCSITANDGTVKGGTYFPITVTKALRAQHVSVRYADGLFTCSVSNLYCAASIGG